MGKSGSKVLAAEPTFDLARLDEIPDDIRAVIERHISSQSDQIDELKSSYERLRVDSGERQKPKLFFTLSDSMFFSILHLFCK